MYYNATSPNWLAVTSNGGSRTETNTGIAVVANSFSRFRISVNADGTSVGFYIDDVLVATNTTNIPTVNLTGIGIKIGNLIGTTVSKSLYTDYVSVSATFGASR
jgi:hypothetical protein